MRRQYKILFLNPRAAKVFQDLACDLAYRWSPSLIWTEVSKIVQFRSDEDLIVQKIPGYACYSRKNYLTRAFSIVSYFVYVMMKVLFNSPKSLLFIVTTPPFLGFIGYLFKKLRKQHYVMLIYDILPAALIGAGMMPNGVFVGMWRKFNRIILNNADAVITIGEYMAENLVKEFDVGKTPLGHIAIVHNWADVELIKPLPKDENPFIREYGLKGRFIVMYSGNIGATHDMETLISAAVELKENHQVQFVIIGEGAKKQFVVDSKEKYGLDNLLILPYLPQDQLAFSLPAADIAITTIANGVEGYLVPCKFYAYLAAGNAVIAVCNNNCEIADIIKMEQCGKVVALGDKAALVESILCYYQNKDILYNAQVNSRNAAVKKYSRKNTGLYIKIIENIYMTNESVFGAAVN